nr:unnamed protein product [Spirometra erinaceieuropaei]
MLKPPPNAAYNACLIIVNGVKLQVIEAFIYLGSALSRSTKVEDEVGPLDLQSQPSLRSPAEHCLESSRSPPRHQAQDIKSCNLDDSAARSGDLEGVQKAGADAQQLSPHLPSVDTKAEVAGPDPG